MRPRKEINEADAISAFTTKKVMTIVEILESLDCSITTARRRLKEWSVYTSYNKNGRYYTLPQIPQFNKKGLWKYRDVYFSKHGSFKKTIIHFVKTSRKGLSNSEIEELLGINPNSFLPHFEGMVELKKERCGRDVVYFSTEEEAYRIQKENRFPPEPPTLQLPPDAITIIILLEIIKKPGRTIQELTKGLQKTGHDIETQTIQNVFETHGLSKKKL